MSFQFIDILFFPSKVTLPASFDSCSEVASYHSMWGNLISPTSFAIFTSITSSKSIGFKTTLRANRGRRSGSMDQLGTGWNIRRMSGHKARARPRFSSPDQVQFRQYMGAGFRARQTRCVTRIQARFQGISCVQARQARLARVSRIASSGGLSGTSSAAPVRC